MPSEVFKAAARVVEAPTRLIENYKKAYNAHVSIQRNAQATDQILQLITQGSPEEEIVKLVRELPEEWQIDLIIRAIDPYYLNDMPHFIGLVECVEEASSALNRMEWNRLIDIASDRQDTFEGRGCGYLHLKIVEYLKEKSVNALRVPDGPKLLWRV